MELTDFLKIQRDEYLRALNLMLLKMNSKYETFVEAIEYKENISNSEVEELNYYRYDVFPKTGDDSYIEIIVNVNPVVFDKPQTYKFNNLELIIDSFVWNACEFRLPSKPLMPVLLKSWFLKWVDVDNDFMYKEYQNFIHAVVIKQEHAEQVLVFDFGTASTDAIIELLELFSSYGFTTIKVTSNYK